MSIATLFSPQSIAVIGASTRPGSVGNDVLRNILANGYGGEVYPVNPKTSTLLELTCYPDIASITKDVDLAIIIVPAVAVPDVLRQCGEKSVQAAIVISSGFKETGIDGAGRETELQEIAKQYGIALLGPNCLGFLHPKIGLNASFAKQMPQAGSIAFFSQSGALCTALLDMTRDTLGYSHFVSIGNKAVLGENSLLQYFADQEDARVIGFYTEGLENAPNIIGTSRAILTRADAKPIVALKAGTTDAGSHASSSHTGSLAGSDASYQALFRQARIVRAATFQELLDTLSVFSTNALPEGSRVGIVTNAGGLGVLATDTLIKNGLALAAPGEDSKKALQEVLPPSASVENPVDVLGDAKADRYEAALRILEEDSSIDMLLVIVTPQSMTEAVATAQALVDCKRRSKKPLVAVFAGDTSFREAFGVLTQGGVATFLYAEAAAEALGKLAQAGIWRKKTETTPFALNDVDPASARSVIEKAKSERRFRLHESEAKEILEHYGFLFPKTLIVKSPEEAQAAAQGFSRPFAMKVVSPDIIHKSDVGGVILSVTPEGTEAAYRTILENVSLKAPEAKVTGVLLSEMAPEGGKELILGIKEEPGLGKLIMVGLGGIFVEIFKDVSFRFAPLTEEDAEEMIAELKSEPLLAGTRGQKAIDRKALLEAIGRLSRLVTDFPEIQELDINPLLAFEEGVPLLALDARMTLREEYK